MNSLETQEFVYLDIIRGRRVGVCMLSGIRFWCNDVAAAAAAELIMMMMMMQESFRGGTRGNADHFVR